MCLVRQAVRVSLCPCGKREGLCLFCWSTSTRVTTPPPPLCKVLLMTPAQLTPAAKCSSYKINRHCYSATTHTVWNKRNKSVLFCCIGPPPGTPCVHQKKRDQNNKNCASTAKNLRYYGMPQKMNVLQARVTAKSFSRNRRLANNEVS